MAQRLDLRAPSDLAVHYAAMGELAPGLDRHRLFTPAAADHFDQPINASRGPAPSGHIASPMEKMVQNFRQEGLPIAKLFQSTNSLVHLGLNPKGKPGLWLVHKMH